MYNPSSKKVGTLWHKNRMWWFANRFQPIHRYSVETRFIMFLVNILSFWIWYLQHILHVLQQHGFVVKECRYHTGLPAVQTCLQLKMCGATEVVYQARTGKSLIFKTLTTGVFSSQFCLAECCQRKRFISLNIKYIFFLLFSWIQIEKYLPIIALCFRLHFTQCPNLFQVRVI